MVAHCKFFLAPRGRCSNKDCEFQHNVEHKRRLNNTKCRFGKQCANGFCAYKHPDSAPSGNNKPQQQQRPSGGGAKETRFKVATLKGRRVEFAMSLDGTVWQAKQKAAELLNFNITELELMLGAKPLEDDTKTLRAYEVAISKGGVGHLTAVQRFFGGGGDRKGAAEVVVQLKYARKAHNIVGVDLIDDDIMRWRVLLLGPDSGPFRHGLFTLRMEFSANYPHDRPLVTFESPMFHPNVYASGALCWNDNDDSGQTFWADILVGGINRILLRPNPFSPANSTAAQLLRTDPAAYERRARGLIKVARV